MLHHADELPTRQRDSLLACFGMVEADEVNPLFTSHMTPYGEVRLRMDTRLALTQPAPEQEAEPTAP